VRFVKKDEYSKFGYAVDGDRFSVVLCFNQSLQQSQIIQTKKWVRAANDLVIKHGGTFYLPYQQFASQKQFEDLRKQFQAVSKQVEADINQSKQENRQALLLLQAQIESLKQDTANFQGEREQLLREISLLQRAQKNINAEIEGRFQKIQAQLAKQDAPPPSPPVNEEAPKSIKVNVQVDGFEFLAEPEEKRDFEAAFVLFRKGDFAAAAKEFAQFVRVYSNSGYKPSALYWLGSAKFARRDFNDAITQLKGLVNDFPTHTRAAEALLTVGTAQLEIKQPKEARKTFNDLIKIYPTSEAAAAAKDRLTQIK
jgi:tol-pal system protein YbgF